MRKYKHNLGLIGVMAAIIFIGGSSVFALPSQANAHAQAATTNTQDSRNNASQGSANAAAAQANSQGHLAAARLKACQNRENAISNIMARIADRGQKQLTLFNTIANRTEAFYTTKGKTLSTYDNLVADVNNKQAAAQNEVDAIKTASTGFSCDSSDPKSFVDSFQSSLKGEISALQDYRTSVKNLIVGVKSVQGQTASSSSSTAGGSQ